MDKDNYHNYYCTHRNDAYNLDIFFICIHRKLIRLAYRKKNIIENLKKKCLRTRAKCLAFHDDTSYIAGWVLYEGYGLPIILRVNFFSRIFFHINHYK
jgi:hypothetical protein